MRVIVCQTSIGREFEDIHRPCVQDVARWCARHGYEHLVQKENLLPERHPSWCRMILIETLLDKADWVCYLDCDLVVRSMGLNLDKWLTNDLVMAHDPQFVVNTGLMLMRDSPWARKFLHEVVADTRWPKYASLCREQDIVELWMAEHPDETKEHIRIARDFFAYPKAYTRVINPEKSALLDKNIPFIHFCGRKRNKSYVDIARRKYLEDYMPRPDEIFGMSPPEELALLRRMAAGRDVVAEIGVFCGRQTCVLAQECKRVYAVDNWSGYSPAKTKREWRYGEFPRKGAEEAFDDLAKLYPNIIKCKTDSKVWQAPEELDLIFIDGDHSYAGVKADIQVARRSVKTAYQNNLMAGGLICGHDYVVPEVAKAVNEAISSPEFAGFKLVVHPTRFGIWEFVPI